MSGSSLRESRFFSLQLPKYLMGLGLVFLAISLSQFLGHDHHQQSYVLYSYLTSFIFFLSLSMGSLFLVLIQFLARGGWGVLVRRIPEHLMRNIALMALLFVPIYLGISHLYEWAHPGILEYDHLIRIKSPYLNKPFFMIRALLYFVIWFVISQFYFKQSTDQDSSGSDQQTKLMQRRSAPSILLFALSYTFASFDWIMSLSPHWFSTIFGLYIFANSVLGALCVTSLLYMLLRRAGFLRDIVTIEHYHDLGKLIYGFIVFWAYIAFSQYFLIWYANIPEETVWFANRQIGIWPKLVMVILVLHFVFPLFAFMSRHVKRNLLAHACIVSLVLFACYLDFYVAIMPNYHHYDEFKNPLLDLVNVLGVGCIYFAVFFKGLSRFSLIPEKDPRISESINFENH